MNREPSADQPRRTQWLVAHNTPDEWEARLVRTALINDRIRCRLESRKSPSGLSEYVLLVQSPDETEARDLIDHVLHVLVSQPANAEIIPPENPPAKPQKSTPAAEVPRASPTAYESVVIASREGIGEIVHHIGRGFELRVGPRPHYIVEESRWEEFTDFSAQRQEFAILLRAEYTNLFEWIKENKLMGEFIKLVESTYRDVPPPRLSRRTRQQPMMPVNPFAVSSIAVAIFAALAVLMVLPWYVELLLGTTALVCGLVGRYQIGLNKDTQRGTLLAMLGVGIACVVIAMALVTRQTTQSPPIGYSGGGSESRVCLLPHANSAPTSYPSNSHRLCRV